MSLIAKTYQYLTWQWRVSREVLAKARLHTILGVLALVFAKYSQVFAMFLPLKVLILLSSEHVPYYFASFMTTDTKPYWIVGFSAATFVLYILSIVLITVSNRRFTKGSNQLLMLQQATRVFTRNERRRLRDHYFDLWQCNAEALVAVFGGLMIAILNPMIFLVLGFFLLTQLSAAGLIIKHHRSGIIGRIGDKLRNELDNVLQYLIALTFLVVFMLILLQFYLAGELNIISSILTIFVARRALQSLARFVKKAVLLDAERQDVERLLAYPPSTQCLALERETPAETYQSKT